LRVCLIAPPDGPGERGVACFERLAELLAGDHEVTLIRVRDPGGQPSEEWEEGLPYRVVQAAPRPEMARTVFAGRGHRLSAAVMEAIEAAFGGDGPDYVEVADRHALGLVPLMARRCANPLLERTLFGVRLLGSVELEALHDGALGEPDTRLLGELEREQLRLADRLIWPGGDALELYRRYYRGPLPEGVRIGQPLGPGGEAAPPVARDREGPLRILYVGGLRRCDGALGLAEACLRLPLDDWRLTLAGEDTQTAPAGQSVELTLGEMFGEDPRLTIAGPLAGEELERAFAAHDLLVVPPTFAVWPEIALEGMRAGLPILATPIGGLPEILGDGEAGWLTAGLDPGEIRRSLLRLIEDRDEVERVRRSGGPRERFHQLVDQQPVEAAYGRLLESARAPAPPVARSRGGEEPLVSGVVTYFRGSPFVEEAVRSLLDQTHDRVEAIVINDGSFEGADEVLDRIAVDPRVRLVTQLNRGETSARNLGARLARGEYVVMLDADNVLEPQFVARALEAFARESELAYVSCWLRFIGPDGSLVADPAGYAALGNGVVSDDTNNWDGDTLALLPRRIFTEHGLGFDPAAVIYSDWELYRALREAGRYGVVIPERLARYRVLPSSLQRAHGKDMHRRGWEEARERRILRATRWTAEDRDGRG
jgi:GT2 family glycosyltransferase